MKMSYFFPILIPVIKLPMALASIVCQKVFSYNREEDIWNKVRKSSETGQWTEISIICFCEMFDQSLISERRMKTRFCLHQISRLLKYLLISYDPKSEVVLQLVYSVLCTKYQVLLYLWRIKPTIESWNV